MDTHEAWGAAEAKRRLHDAEFRDELDDLYQKGKVNGLMQAQVTALAYAHQAHRPDIRKAAQEIAEKIADDIARIERRLYKRNDDAS